MNILIRVFVLTWLPAAMVLAAPDIEVLKTVDNATPVANEPVEFTVQTSNIGDQVATGVVVIDQLPVQMVIPGGTAAFTSVGSYDPATGEWTIGDLAPGALATLVVPAMVTDPSPPECIVNTASSAFTDIAGDANDDSRAAIRQPGVERCVDLEVNFGISASTLFIFPACNSQERYSGDVTVTNAGPDAARNVLVTLSQNPVVGPNLRFSDADCSGAASAQCQIAEIDAGETVTINVTSDLYQSASVFTQTLSVSASTSDVDYDPGNDSPSATGSGGGFSSCDTFDPDIDIGAPGGCFVATAAYGSYLEPEVLTLRKLRDKYLLTNAPGRKFVDWYYQTSPPVADYIARHEWARTASRWALTPLVYSVKYPVAALALLLSVMVIAGRWIRRRTLGDSAIQGGSGG